MSEPSIDQSRFAREMTSQSRRLYHAQRWIGPTGTTGAAVFVTWPLWDLVDRERLLVWLGAVITMAAATVVAFSVPWSARRRSTTGIPILSEISHLGIGVVGGLLAWVDQRAFADDTATRMSVLCYLFAMTLGVSRGTSALGRLVVLVAGPMWMLMIVGLLAVGQFALTVGLLVCALLLVGGQLDDRRVWRELVELRVAAADEADLRREEAFRDPLTGLHNRRGAVARIEATLDRQQAGAHVAAFFIDLDRFKPINDRYGHNCGDQVLVEIAGRLIDRCRPDDTVARIGGDEFLVLITAPGPFGPTHLTASAERLVRAIEEPVVTDVDEARSVSLSASIGIATTPARAIDCDELIRRADKAMYEAKRADDPDRKVVLRTQPA